MTIFSPLLKTKISSFISALSIKLILSLFSNFRNFQPESHVCCKHSESEGGLVPSRNFYVRTRVNFTRANNREAMYGEYRVNVNVEPQSTLTFMHVFHTLPFFNARKIYVCTHVKIAQQWKSTLNASVNSSCAQPPTPPPPPSPPGYFKAFARLVSPGSPGDGAFANFVLTGGWAFAKPWAAPELLTRTRFPIRIICRFSQG